MKKYHCDLHTHSLGSDGSETIEELIERAKKNNIGVMAITDHNWSTILEPIKQDELLVVPGVEFDAYWIPEPYIEKYDIHVVGIFPSGLTEEVRITQNPAIARGRERFIRENIRMLKEKEGIEISYDELKMLQTNPEKITRGTIADLLVSKGYYHTTREAFQNCLGRESGKETYIPVEDYIPYVRVQNIVTFVIEQHGIPIIAHPLLWGFSDVTLRQLLHDFKSCLPEGYPSAIEAEYEAYLPVQRAYLRSLAEDYGMLSSVGSDSHGPSQALAHGDINLYYTMIDSLETYWRNKFVVKEGME